VSPDWVKTPAGKIRGRGLGLAFPGVPGLLNAITDVAGVELGVVTLIEGSDIRTGVTAILPRGRNKAHIPCAAGSFSFNGNGEMTGLAWIEEAGELQTPITITNTNSCGVSRDATLQWLVKNKIGTGQDWGLPVAAETYDGDLNDINGFYVTIEHVMQALDNAHAGAFDLGSVGGGTGMITYDFKAGNGSSSRRVEIDQQTFTLGVFVQSNFGQREDFTVLGVPVGQHILQDKLRGKDQGSIIAIIATDAPLQPHQLKRLARRVPLGMARTGTIGSNSSGDIFLAFSTANENSFVGAKRTADYIANNALDGLFRAVVEATEEAILDSMICNDTMIGINGNKSIALPHDQLKDVIRQYARLPKILPQ
jgi:D-aminopeptidase